MHYFLAQGVIILIKLIKEKSVRINFILILRFSDNNNKLDINFSNCNSYPVSRYSYFANKRFNKVLLYTCRQTNKHFIVIYYNSFKELKTFNIK